MFLDKESQPLPSNPLAAVINELDWDFCPIDYDKIKCIVFDISKIALSPAIVLVMLEMLKENGYVEIDYNDHTIKRV